MIQFKSKTIKCGDRHSLPAEGSPTAHVRAHYFWARRGESHVIGDGGSREIIVNCIVSDSTFTTAKKLFDYLNELDKMITRNGRLSVTKAGQSRTYKAVYLNAVTRVAQTGQTNAVPLPDIVGGTVGPGEGGWWQEVNLQFVEVQP